MMTFVRALRLRLIAPASFTRMLSCCAGAAGELCEESAVCNNVQRMPMESCVLREGTAEGLCGSNV